MADVERFGGIGGVSHKERLPSYFSSLVVVAHTLRELALRSRIVDRRRYAQSTFLHDMHLIMHEGYIRYEVAMTARVPRVQHS